MGKTRYKKIIEMLNDLKMTNGNLIKTEDFIKAIRINIGCDLKQTVRPTIINLRELNLIEEREDGIWIK